jgi:hypothetical protein
MTAVESHPELTVDVIPRSTEDGRSTTLFDGAGVEWTVTMLGEDPANPAWMFRVRPRARVPAARQPARAGYCRRPNR